MGTHPIFESDFDCLTEKTKDKQTWTKRKRNNENTNCAKMDTRALPPPDYKMQLIIIGDSGVGKTSFMDRFVEGNHRAAYNATVGIDFKVRRLNIGDKTVKLQIWDTAGQEKVNAITTAYYRQARAAIIMYDVTRANTFANLRKWFRLLEENGRPDICVALVGNKSDSGRNRDVMTKMPPENHAPYPTNLHIRQRDHS